MGKKLSNRLFDLFKTANEFRRLFAFQPTLTSMSTSGGSTVPPIRRSIVFQPRMLTWIHVSNFTIAVGSKDTCEDTTYARYAFISTVGRKGKSHVSAGVAYGAKSSVSITLFHFEW